MTLCSPVVSGRQKNGSGSSALSKKSPRIAAVAVARKALNIKGFCAIKKGSPLYNKAKALYKK